LSAVTKHMREMADSKRMQIRFASEENQIDSNTLINYLIHYNAVVSEINDVYGEGNKKIKVKINALEKGSFIIDVSLQDDSFLSLFSNESVNYVAGIVTIATGILGVYHHFKGKLIKNKEDKDTAEIIFKDLNINEDIQINQTIINIYNRKEVREAISKSFQTVDEDENVDGVEISNDVNESTVSFKREEFDELKYSDFAHENDIPRNIEEVVEATLTIISLNFERGNRWQFMYNGFKIAMIVKDDALMERIDNGDRFGKGDSIRVKMRIQKEYNISYKAYENRSYKIVEFIEHIVSPTQGSFPF
jgi:hypothetical protein